MKLRTIVVATMAALTLGVVGASYAGVSSNYYPPERIHCGLDSNKLNCEGFNRKYLTEDTHTADFGTRDQSFSFTSGAAYFTPDKSEATVFFTYRNSHHKNVKFKTTATSIRPDFEYGNWTKVSDDLYVCKSGYMKCPITSL